MNLDALLDRLEKEESNNDSTLLDHSKRNGTVSPVASRNPMGLPEKPSRNNAVSPVSPVTLENASSGKDPAVTVRRESESALRSDRVLATLAENPKLKRAIITDLESDPDNVILTIGIRDQYLFELLIPREKYNGFLLLEILNRNVAH